MNDDEIEIRAAGFIGKHDVYHLDPRECRCGDITDGVALRLNDEAGGVLDFEDFERAYLAAKALRQPTKDEGAR